MTIELDALRALTYNERKEIAAEIAALAVSERPGSAKFSNTALRVMVPLIQQVYSTPESKLTTMVEALAVDPTGADYIRVTPENVVELLLKHTGPEDVPSAQTAESMGLNLWDMIELMIADRPVYSYEIQWSPQWLRKLRGDFLPEPPEGWLSVSLVSELKGITERTVKEYCTKIVDGNRRLDSARCKGGVWYINPNEKLDYWITKINDNGTTHRRIEMVLEVIDSNNPTNLDTMWGLVSIAEREMPKLGAYEDYSARRYIERSLENANVRQPTSVQEWKQYGPKILMHIYLAMEHEREQD